MNETKYFINAFGEVDEIAPNINNRREIERLQAIGNFFNNKETAIKALWRMRKAI